MVRQTTSGDEMKKPRRYTVNRDGTDIGMMSDRHNLFIGYWTNSAIHILFHSLCWAVNMLHGNLRQAVLYDSSLAVG